jgi:biopolymer transport protein ExbD
MKLSNRKSRGSLPELLLTSMIDVVFLLLIFFMTTTSWFQTERHLDSVIRVQQKSARAAAADLQPAIVDVLRSGDRFVFRIGVRDIESTEELTDVLRQFENKEDGAFVRVADDAPFAMAAAAVQACKSANFVPVSYVPQQTE